MERSEFWELFMETGEPYYWLLSRAEDRTSAPQSNSTTAGEERTPPAPG